MLKVLNGALFIYLRLMGFMVSLRRMIVDPFVVSMDAQNTTIAVFMAAIHHLS